MARPLPASKRSIVAPLAPPPVRQVASNRYARRAEGLRNTAGNRRVAFIAGAIAEAQRHAHRKARPHA